MMVTNKRSERLLQAWRSGVTLSAALDQFDPKFDRLEYAQKRQSNSELIEIGKRNFQRIGATNFDELEQWLSKSMSRLSAAGLSLQSRRVQLFKALEAGDLVALGYAADKPKAEAPEPVPQFLIQVKYAKFSKSEFSDGGRCYLKVRIVKGSALARPEIGRPSVRKSIFELAAVLANSGEITREMPPKRQAGKIRQLGSFREAVPSDQTIKRHLKSFWNCN